MSINVSRVQSQINSAAEKAGILKTGYFIANRGKVTESKIKIKVIRSSFKQSMVDGESIRIGDSELIVTQDQLDFTPMSGQSIEIAGEIFSLLILDDDPLGVVYVFRGRR